jgi:Tfp pilus assembly protein PilN
MSKPTMASFLPEDYMRRKRDSRGLIVNVALFALMIGVVGSAFVVTNRQWSLVKTEHAQAQSDYDNEAAKIEQLKEMEDKRQFLLRRAEVTTALIERVPRSILVAELVNRMPEGTTLTDVVMESSRAAVQAAVRVDASSTKSIADVAKEAAKKQGITAAPPVYDFRLTISGLAANDTAVADFQTALKGCPLLDKVDLVSTVEHIDGDRAMRKFRIEASIKPTADSASIKPLAMARGGVNHAADGKIDQPGGGLWNKLLKKRNNADDNTPTGQPSEGKHVEADTKAE